jgi:hypothetical protein
MLQDARCQANEGCSVPHSAFSWLILSGFLL